MLPNPQILADLVTFTEEILNEKLHIFAVDVVNVSFPKSFAYLLNEWSLGQFTTKRADII